MCSPYFTLGGIVIRQSYIGQAAAHCQDLSWIPQPWRRRTESSIGTLLMQASLVCM